MPVNFEQLQAQIIAAGESIRAERLASQQALERCRAQFRSLAGMSDLIEQVHAELSRSPQLCCAIPREADPSGWHPLPPEDKQPVTLLAADGSQISPQRHDEVSFGLVNAAVFQIKIGSGETPVIHTETRLLERLPNLSQELRTTEEQIGHLRDLAERTLLAQQAAAISDGSAVIALTDGPLESYLSQKSIENQSQEITDYNEYYRKMQAAAVIPAGYIDRPRSSYLIQLLELLFGDSVPALSAATTANAFFDSGLFASLLPPDARSTVFRLASPVVRAMPEAFQLSFFYLNVGTAREPVITRVEIPEWVAVNPAAVDLVHFHLIQQCRMLPASPYPYALHRAHESAVVQLAEKERIKNLLISQLRISDLTVQSKSGKQTAKDRAAVRYSR